MINTVVQIFNLDVNITYMWSMFVSVVGREDRNFTTIPGNHPIAYPNDVNAPIVM